MDRRLELKKMIENKNLFPLVPITGYSNKPYCPWSNEIYWLNSTENLNNKFQWENKEGEKKSGNVTGYSLLTGKRSNITVIDLDANHKDGVNGIDNFNRLIKSLSKEDISTIDSTFSVKTPRGGKHLYFKYVPGISNAANVIEDNSGIDIRNDGGQVPIAYSRRKLEDKKIYQYEVLQDSEIKEMPLALINLIKKGKNRKPVDIDELDDMFLPLKGMSEGDGRNVEFNKLLFKYCKQNNIKNWTAIKAIARMINEEYFAEPEEGLLATAKSVCNKINTDELSHKRDIKALDFVKSLELEPIKEPKFLVHRLIYDNSINLITGDPKTFKTYVALDIAIGIITGTETIGHSVLKKGKVLLISTELDVRSRIINLIKGRGAELKEFEGKLRLYDYESLDTFEWNKDKDQVEEWIIDFKPDLVILDPISYIFDGEITDNGEVKQFFKELKELINKYKFSVILTHHNNRMKNTNRNGKISGAAAFSRHSDSIIHLEKFEEDEKQDINKSDEELDNEVKSIKLIKGDYRFGKTGYRYYSLNLKFEKDLTRIVTNRLEIDGTIIKDKKINEHENMIDREEDIIKRIIECAKKGLFSSEGVKRTEIELIVNNNYGVSKETYKRDILKVLDILVKDGYIKKKGYKYYVIDTNIEYPFLGIGG